MRCTSHPSSTLRLNGTFSLRFNRHSDLEGTHAKFSASKYHWINWPDDKIDHALEVHEAAAKGTRLHNLARLAIDDSIKLSMDPDDMEEPYQATVALFVRDAVNLGMRAEVLLRYTDNFFGTADAIGYTTNHLRIHDLKTGVNKVSPTQLYVYAALFCLEYGVRPFAIETELRIYQLGEIITIIADAEFIAHIMSRMVYIEERIQAREEL